MRKLLEESSVAQSLDGIGRLAGSLRFPVGMEARRTDLNSQDQRSTGYRFYREFMICVSNAARLSFLCKISNDHFVADAL